MKYIQMKINWNVTLIFQQGNLQFPVYPCSPCVEWSGHKLRLCLQANETGGLASLNKLRNHAFILNTQELFVNLNSFLLV